MVPRLNDSFVDVTAGFVNSIVSDRYVRIKLVYLFNLQLSIACTRYKSLY